MSRGFVCLSAYPTRVISVWESARPGVLRHLEFFFPLGWPCEAFTFSACSLEGLGEVIHPGAVKRRLPVQRVLVR
eukprot:scaffold265485_cov33-Tisochrysis_lutea.AAC.1